MKAKLTMFRERTLASMISEINSCHDTSQFKAFMQVLTKYRALPDWCFSAPDWMIDLPDSKELTNTAVSDYASALLFLSLVDSQPRSLFADARFLSYLATVEYFDALTIRWRDIVGSDTKRGRFTTEWLIQTSSPSSLLRHTVGRLLWPSIMLQLNDATSRNVLLEEYYSHQDYSRLFTSRAARAEVVWQAVLTFSVENRHLFISNKEAKMRHLFRCINLYAARYPVSFFPINHYLELLTRWIKEF